jgi:thymidine kinase
MNAGKSTVLLQAAYNYRERGMTPLLFSSSIDTRDGKGKITSRIGISQEALLFSAEDELFERVDGLNRDVKIDCVFIDEAQFLTKIQVWQLAKVVDKLKVPVMCYGLRTDFQGGLFPGSAELLAVADHLREIRAICWCGKKATMTARLGRGGQVLQDGVQIEVGGDDRYVSLCREHWVLKALS